LVRAIGVIGLAAAIANEVIGSGVYRNPAAMAAAAGTAAPYAYLACLFAMGAIVLCFAEAGSRVPTSGGPYGYVEAAFGPMPGFVAGMLVWLSSVLACGGIAAAVADTVGVIAPVMAGALPRGLFIIAILGLMAWINLRGVDLAARLIGFAMLIKLLPLFFFLIVGGIALAMGSIGILYVAIQVVADALLGAGLIGSKAPLADALGTLDPRLRAPLLLGAFLSMLFWLGSDLLGAPRVLFAFARDGLLPSSLGRLHTRWKTPHIAIIVHAVIAAGLALSGTYEALAILSTLAIAPLYASVCAASVALRRRNVAILGKPLALPLLPAVAIVGMVSMTALVAIAELVEIGALLGVLVGSVLLFLAMRKRP
jgi:amino acid transporter